MAPDELEQEIERRRVQARRSTRRFNRLLSLMLVPYVAIGLLLVGACIGAGIWVGGAAFFVLFFVLPPIIFRLMSRLQA